MHKLFNWLLRNRESQTSQLGRQLKQSQNQIDVLIAQLATRPDIKLDNIIELVEEIRKFNAGAVDEALDNHIDVALDAWVKKHHINTNIMQGCSKYKGGCTFSRQKN